MEGIALEKKSIHDMSWPELIAYSGRLEEFVTVYKEWSELNSVYHHCGDMDLSMELWEPMKEAKDKLNELAIAIVGHGLE